MTVFAASPEKNARYTSVMRGGPKCRNVCKCFGGWGT